MIASTSPEFWGEERDISWDTPFCIQAEFARRLDMDSETAEQILDELAPTFQKLETESAAIVQFLKAKGVANDDELAPYIEQAANASSVRWRAIRVRMARLLVS